MKALWKVCKIIQRIFEFLIIIFSTDFNVSMMVLKFYHLSDFSCALVGFRDDNIAEETKVFQLFLLRTADLDQSITILNSPPGILFLQDDDGIVSSK